MKAIYLKYVGGCLIARHFHWGVFLSLGRLT